jgi:hypothetical protein
MSLGDIRRGVYKTKIIFSSRPQCGAVPRLFAHYFAHYVWPMHGGLIVRIWGAGEPFTNP